MISLGSVYPQTVWYLQPGEGWGFVSIKDETVWRDIPIWVPELGEIDMPDLEDMGYVGKDGLPNVDLYFTPNLFSKPARRIEHVLPSSWLYADLDAVDPFTIEEELEPSIAWETSPGRYQALWELPSPLEPLSHGQINKQLTYRLKADRSGWDATQVLRVPGTTNYKYPSQPVGRLLWDNVPHVSKRGYILLSADPHLTKPHISPPVALNGDGRPVKMGALPAGVRMKLRAKAATGDRSKVLWRLEKQLLEHGFDQAQVLELLRGTVWNKFNSDERLMAEIQRAAL